MSRLARPNAAEEEEDLLRQMEAFEASSGSLLEPPSAAAAAMSSSDKERRPTSKFAEMRHNLNRRIGAALDYERSPDSIAGLEASSTHTSTPSTCLKAAVVERRGHFNWGHFSAKERSAENPLQSQGFPAASRRPEACEGPKDEVRADGTIKRVSIFAQHQRGVRPDHCPAKEVLVEQSWEQEAGQQGTLRRDWGEESRVLKHSAVLSESDKRDIHLGNVNILSSMSQEQLARDRQELLATLKPATLRFLLSSSKKGPATTGRAATPGTSMLREQPEVRNEVGTGSKTGAKVFPCDGVAADAMMTTQLAASNHPPVTSTTTLLQMDSMEAEKMQWMADLPASAEEDAVGDGPTRPDGFNARFDFEGRPMPFRSDDIPVNVGLHHHGEEPERPGYSLEELLTLARSTFPQQRTVALQVLGKVVYNAKNGLFDSCFDSNVIIRLLEADLLTLLRMIIDEAHCPETVLDSAMACLASVVDHEVEEAALDAQFFVDGNRDGHVQPSLATSFAKQTLHKTSSTTDDPDQRDLSEMKDVEVLRSDVVMGLLRTDILERFAYLITIMSQEESQKTTSTAIIVNMLRVLSRMARHSLQTASRIIDHPKLLGIIFQSYLPVRPSLNLLGGGGPLFQALKLVRILMSWSRSFTLHIIEKFGLDSHLLCYVGAEFDRALSQKEGTNLGPKDTKELNEALKLSIEAIRAWIVCLRYGVLASQFRAFTSIIHQHLNNNARKSIDIVDPSDSSKFIHHFEAAIMQLLNAAICCCSGSSPGSGPVSCDPHSVTDKNYAVQNLHLEWEAVELHVQTVIQCLDKWAAQLSSAVIKRVKPFCLNLLSSAFQVLATFIQRRGGAFGSGDPSFGAVARNEETKAVINRVLERVVSAPFFVNLLSESNEYSIFNDAQRDGRQRDPPSLPTLGPIKFAGDITGCLKEGSPFGLLSSFFHLVEVVFEKSFETVSTEETASKVFSSLTGPNFQRYLSSFVERSEYDTKSNWFCKPELSMLFSVVQMFRRMRLVRGRMEAGVDPSFTWRLSMTLLVHLQVGQEFLARRLVDDIIFDPEFCLFNIDLITAELEQLGMTSTTTTTALTDRQPDLADILRPQGSCGGSSTSSKFGQMLQDPKRALPQLRRLFEKFLFRDTAMVGKSYHLYNQMCFSTSSLTLASNGETVLPSDWQFLPLLAVLQRRLQKKAQDPSEKNLRYDESDLVEGCLFWVYITTMVNVNKTVQGSLGRASRTLRLSRLMTVFLAASDLFLDPGIHELTKRSIKAILLQSGKTKKPSKQQVVFPEDGVPGIDSFKDFYNELLDQFKSVSYGDHLFSLAILLPCTSRNPLSYRTALWSDNSDCLRSITLTPQQLSPFGLDVSDFFVDATNPSQDPKIHALLLRSYCRALVSGDVVAIRNPLLYQIASVNLRIALQETEKAGLGDQLRGEIVANLKKSNLADIFAT